MYHFLSDLRWLPPTPTTYTFLGFPFTQVPVSCPSSLRHRSRPKTARSLYQQRGWCTVHQVIGPSLSHSWITLQLDSALIVLWHFHRLPQGWSPSPSDPLSGLDLLCHWFLHPHPIPPPQAFPVGSIHDGAVGVEKFNHWPNLYDDSMLVYNYDVEMKNMV